MIISDSSPSERGWVRGEARHKEEGRLLLSTANALTLTLSQREREFI
jgi:hypothetical protein